MRYLKQAHATTCGPTAVVNAMKWARCPYASRDCAYRWISDQHGLIGSGVGLPHDIIQDVCRYFLPKGTTIRRIRASVAFNTIEHLTKYKEHGAAIIAYGHTGDAAGEGHYIFAPHVYADYAAVEVVNQSLKGPARDAMHIHDFISMVETVNNTEWPFALLIRKPEG